MVILYFNKKNYPNLYIRQYRMKILKIWLILIYILIVDNYSYDYSINNCLIILKKFNLKINLILNLL